MADPLLNQLHDIHLPLPISGWPLAPGWIAMIIVGLLSLIFLMGYLYRITIKKRAIQQALKLLALYHQAYLSNGNAQHSSTQISELLRRVAMTYFPREKVASLKGEAWISFLNEHAKHLDFTQVQDLLIKLPYQLTTSAEYDLEPLFSHAKIWIKQRGSRCSN